MISQTKTQNKTNILLFSLLLFFFISLFFVNCECGVETSTDTPNCDSKDPNSDCDKDGIKNSADVDKDNDGLIEIHTLAQFHALRTDLDGDGLFDEGAIADNNLRGAVGCPDGGCQGYELAGDLNFDENGDGEQNDTYNQDDGTWEWDFFENAPDVFVGSFEQPAGIAAVSWEFSECSDNSGNLAYNVLSQEHFNHCDGLFQGEFVEALTFRRSVHLQNDCPQRKTSISFFPFREYKLDGRVQTYRSYNF